MKTLALISALFTFSAFAQVDSLIKLYDGGVARCQSKADVYKHRLSSVYRPLKVTQNGTEAKVTIEFLRCVKKDNHYAFTRDNTISAQRIVEDEFSGRDLSIIKDNFSMVAINARGKLIDRAPIVANNDGTYSAILNIKTDEYDPAPTGKKSLKISVQSRFKITDANSQEELDRGNEILGAYRLIIK